MSWLIGGQNFKVSLKTNAKLCLRNFEMKNQAEQIAADVVNLEKNRRPEAAVVNHIFIGLGSNLSEPTKQITSALTAINSLADTTVVKCSSLYSSKPMGPQDQPDYVNAVAELRSKLEPLALLSGLQNIEFEHGRTRNGKRWTARTLDLDIILYDKQIIQLANLNVPHPGMKEREFVLYPLFELAPQLRLPCGNTLKSILHRVTRNGLFVLEKDVEWGKEPT